MFRTLATDKITIVISHRLALCQAELMSKRGQYHPNSYQSKKPWCAREVKLSEKSNDEDFSPVSLSRSGVRE
ncbi:hypothetical protein [Microcystis sp. M061S2]|uniref:hypothetical protein n=1 Tax=Microcystis sp. M061S2 TaxID=2771171 RepID=UPI0025898254|nr:hypothetical protein [Microcystis sp. M061S2]MCA2655528.1 hypothetical protein [Microcystis sp. M061S2]